MSVTDELRDHAAREAPFYEMDVLLGIADRIDAALGDADATGARHGADPDPDRVRELLYSCESREELCARVAALEAVVGRVG